MSCRNEFQESGSQSEFGERDFKHAECR